MLEGMSSSSTPGPVLLHILPTRSDSGQQVEWTEQGQLGQARSRSAPATGGGCGQRLVASSRWHPVALSGEQIAHCGSGSEFTFGSRRGRRNTGSPREGGPKDIVTGDGQRGAS